MSTTTITSHIGFPGAGGAPGDRVSSNDRVRSDVCTFYNFSDYRALLVVPASPVFPVRKERLEKQVEMVEQQLWVIEI